MRDLFRPRHGRMSIAPSTLAVIGWCLAVAFGGGAALGLLPTLSARGPSFQGRSAALVGRARRAADTMRRAERFLRAERERLGVLPDAEGRPDPSGLLGAEVTPLMTTLGSLEAKRIATNPAWADALTCRLAEAGLTHGDVVAASLSGSFPGLNLALASACEALGIRLLGISSVTASTWGANQPGFTWPEMEGRLVEAGLLGRASIAVTAGGDADQALDLEADARALACRIRDAAAASLGIPALAPRDYGEAVRLRLAAYRRAAGGRRIALYVNVGGADASLGRSTAFLRLRSGFLPAVPFGQPDEQGVTAHLAGEGVPLLVLLNVRDLALRWGIPLAGANGDDGLTPRPERAPD